MSFSQTLKQVQFPSAGQAASGSWQALSFFTALMVYAVFGSPTPDKLGISEIVTGILLLASVSVPKIHTLNPIAACFLFYGMSLPLLHGVVAGHGTFIIIRDLIPFFFLFLPLLFGETMERNRNALVGAVTIMGIIFSLRSVWPSREILMSPILWLGRPPADLLYLANSPEVLFSAIMLLGTGGFYIWSRRSVGGGSLLAAASILPLAAMAMMMQRAGLGCAALAACILAAIGLWFRPDRMMLTAGIIAALCLPFLPLAGAVSESLVHKTELVGLNSRTQEWAAVLDLVTRSPWTLLFGMGWGMTFDNPAVGSLTVNYTHSLISALLLKTGLTGGLLCLAYLWIIAKQAVPELFNRPVLMLALGAPLAIGVLFYASYKSLGFGLLLLLLSLYDHRKKLEKNQADMP